MLSADPQVDGGEMICFAPASLLSWLGYRATLRFRSDRAKDLEILLLRRQLAIVRRAQTECAKA
jgi:hypothetical protein